MRITVAVVVAVALSIARSAAAQPAAAAAPPAEVREGLSFGVGLTLGSLVADCDDCRSTFEAGGVQGRAAWMIKPYFAVVGDLWVMVHAEGFLTVYQNLATIGARTSSSATAPASTRRKSATTT